MSKKEPNDAHERSDIVLDVESQEYLQVIEDLNKPRGMGKDVGLTTRLHAGQISVLKDLYVNGKTLILTPSGRKFGKLNRLDEPIFTPTGYKLFGDLVVGSEVFDEQGNVQKVTYLTPIQKNHPAYRVHFCNGSTMDVGEDHLWFTWTKRDRRQYNRGSSNYKPSVKSTKEIFETQMHGKEYNHSIPYTKPLNLSKKDYKVDPYVLGAWLGDGSRDSGRFTTLDMEPLDEFRKLGYVISSHKRDCEWCIKGLVTDLRKINVVKNKHIPQEYLLGDQEQRLALLQGLMDTDGTINKKGNHCCFDNTNKNLAEGAYHLAASLGMKPIWKERTPKFNGKEYKRCYRVMFKPLMPVFRIKRKLDRITYNEVKTLHHTITKVEKIPSSPMRCISVTGDSHLYLIGKSLIPTHNTEVAAYALWRQALLNPGSACYYVCPENTHGRKIIWDTNRLQRFLGNDSAKYIKGNGKNIRNNEMIIPFKNRSFIQVIGSENFGAANGLTPDFAVYDEFKLFHPRWHIDFAPNLIAKAAPLLVIGTLPTPGDKNQEQYMGMLNTAHIDEMSSVHIRTTFDNPINHLPAQKKAIENEINRLRARGEEDVIQREYYSKLIPGGKKAIFPMMSVDAHSRDHKSVLAELSKDLDKLEWHVIADPGNTTVFGVLIVALNPYTKKLYIVDEIYEKNQINTSTSSIYPRIVAKCQALYPNSDMHDDWVKTMDQQAAWFATEVMNQYGVYFQPSAKHLKSKEEGLSLIKDMLLHELVVISDKCTHLWNEMEKYARDDKGNIPKINDHLVDCLRYGLIAMNYTMSEVVEAVRTRNIESNMERGRFRGGLESIEDDEDEWQDIYDF